MFKKKHSRTTQDTLPARRKRVSAQPRESAEGSSQQQLFRRGRTLTGSVSSRILSTAEHGADLKSPRVHAHHLANLRHRLGLVLILTIIASMATLYLMSEFTASLTIKSPGVTLSASQQQKYEVIAEEYYARHPFERFRFALNQGQFLGYLQSKAPEVRSTQVRGTGVTAGAEVSISMRRPVASWIVDREVLYVDAAGVAFATNYYNETKIVKIIDKSGVPTVNGKTLTSQRFLTFVGRLVGEATGYGLQVNEAVLPRNTTRQVEVRLNSIKYPIKYSIDRPVGEQMEDMVRATAYIKKNNLTPRYLDVRVKEKAFYR